MAMVAMHSKMQHGAELQEQAHALAADNAALRRELERQQAKHQLAAFEQQERLAKTVKQQRTNLEQQPEVIRKENAIRLAKMKAESDIELAKEITTREEKVTAAKSDAEKQRVVAERFLMARHEATLQTQRRKLREQHEVWMKAEAQKHIADLDAAEARAVREAATQALVLRGSLEELEADVRGCGSRLEAQADEHTQARKQHADATKKLNTQHAAELAERQAAFGALEAKLASSSASSSKLIETTRAEMREEMAALQAEMAAAAQAAETTLADTEARHAAAMTHAEQALLSAEASAVAKHAQAMMQLREDVTSAVAKGEAAQVALRSQMESAAAASAAVIGGKDSEIDILQVKVANASEEWRTLIAQRDATIAGLEAQVRTMASHGQVRVHLSHATKLRSGDLNGMSDPYIVLNLGGCTEKSAVIKKTLNPRFDWEFIFSFTSVDLALAETLQIEAWDWDSITDDDKLGHGSLALEQHRAQLEAGHRVQCTVPLEYKPLVGKLVAAGQVYIALTWEARTG